MGLASAYGLDRGSPVNIGMSKKKKSKQANAPEKQKITDKFSTYITKAVASGTVDPDKFRNPDHYTADFYRQGKYYADGKSYEIIPRTFTPFESNITASIRMYGKPKDADGYSYLLPAYTKFFLENVQESHAERSQIIETFGDFYVFMFGERPPIYNFSGQLVNSVNASWVTDFMFTYDRFLRGTKCVEQNATVTVVYGGRQAEGLLLSTSTNTNASIDGAVQFNFSMVVFDRVFYSFSEDMGYMNTTEGVDTFAHYLTDDTNLRNLLNTIAGKVGEGSSSYPISDNHKIVKKIGLGTMQSQDTAMA